MKELKNLELLNQYLQVHQIESVFKEQLRPHLSLYSFDQGELVCSQGDTPQYLYFLVKGKLKIYTTSMEGRTLILSFKKPVEVIGDIEYVRGTDFLNTVEAVSPVHMIGVHHQWLKKYGKDYSPLLQFLLEIITEKFYLKSSSLSFNLLEPVEVRLASYLLSISVDEADSPIKDQLSTVHLKDAANLIGTSYRHMNRVIQQFCKDGLVERGNGFILIKNREGLLALSGSSIYE